MSLSSKHTQLDPANPFAGDQSRIQMQETLMRWLLRIGTLFVVSVTLAIVLHIVVKGTPVAFRNEWPFINVRFLTELPATLHVIQDNQGHIIETDVNGADAVKKQLGANLREEKTISYSGGGILGPIVGTAMLVIVSVGVALVLQDNLRVRHHEPHGLVYLLALAERVVLADVFSQWHVEPHGHYFQDGLSHGHRLHVAPFLVREGVDLFDFADGSHVDELDGKALGEVGGNLDAHLRHHALVTCTLHHLTALPQIVRQRLLAIDMFAHLHRRGRHHRMHVIRRGYDEIGRAHV